MNKVLKITGIFVYLFFAHVYPVFHIHGHDHFDKMEIHISVHPPEFPMDIHGKNDEHGHADHHEHEDSHSIKDWDYTFNASKREISHNIEPMFIIDLSDILPLRLNVKLIDIPLIIPQQYLTFYLPDRAPPRLS